MSSSAWRPQQWQTPVPQKVLITFPGQGSAPQYSGAVGSTVTLPNAQTIYAFDAEIQIEHEQRLHKTEHPVQTGASISDHAFLEPARLILDIGMSDAMDAYFNPSTWTGNSSKSVAAYQTMLAIQFSRIPLSITTRLRTYQNMVIESLTPTDTYKTATGLRMRVEFGQIFLAIVSTSTVSARPQDTNSTQLGTVNPQAPSAAQQQQNQVEPTYHPWDSIGAGDYSSVNTENLASLPGPK